MLIPDSRLTDLYISYTNRLKLCKITASYASRVVLRSYKRLVRKLSHKLNKNFTLNRSIAQISHLAYIKYETKYKNKEKYFQKFFELSQFTHEAK